MILPSEVAREVVEDVEGVDMITIEVLDKSFNQFTKNTKRLNV